MASTGSKSTCLSKENLLYKINKMNTTTDYPHINSDYLYMRSLFKQIVDMMPNLPLENVMIISGRSCTNLTNSICTSLNKRQTDVTIVDFANTEITPKLNESIRGKDMFIVQTGASFEGRSVQDHFVELLLLQDACVRASAKSITVIAPFWFYSRSDKRDHRGAIGAKMAMDLVVNGNRANRIISMDFHASQEQAFANVPCDNLYCITLFCNYLKSNVFASSFDPTQSTQSTLSTKLDQIDPNEQFILIAPDAGAEKKVKAYSSNLKLNYRILTKNRDYTKANTVMESHLTGDPTTIVGKTAILVDDMIDTAGTLIQGILELKKYGIKNVIVIASHGVFSGPALERINQTDEIISVIVTNSIPQETNINKCPKITVIDIGPYLAEVIRRLVVGESISDLFEMK